MRFERAAIRMVIALAFLFLAAPWAMAQEYRILRADYGWRDQRVDVTHRLRELARDNAVFRMGNSTFGIDPMPGKVKSLRIYAADAHGHGRMFEYREGSTVDGSIFAGWRSGQWGDHDADHDQDRDRGDHGHDEYYGRYVILRAFYGVPGGNVDVTHRLRETARENVSFRMGNSTFGIDPAPGQVKVLRIFARGPNGDVRMFEYREGSTIDGGVFSGWSHGDWGREEWHGGWNGEDRH
jgi:hypothetical protein